MSSANGFDPTMCGMHAGDLVVFADDRQEQIKEIVENRVRGNVVSYNVKDERFEESEIINWHYNDRMKSVSECVYVETMGPDCDRGRFGFAATNDCELMTDRGWLCVGDLKEGDLLLSKYKSVINGTVADFMWGTLVASSQIKRSDSAVARACVAFKDANNPEYVKWKADKLSAAFDFRFIAHDHCVSNFTFELGKIKEMIQKHDPCLMLRDCYSDIGMAVWYMDHGRLDTNKRKRVIISVKRFKGDVERLGEMERLLEQNGVPCSHVDYKYGSLIYTKEELKNLFSKICKYVPDCMQNKLTEEYRGKYEDFELSCASVWKRYYVPILQMRQISDKQFQNNGKYMISTELGNCMIGSATNGVVIRCGLDTECERECGENVGHIGVVGNTKILYAIDGANGKRVNHKGGAAKHLYDRFYDECKDTLPGRSNRGI